MRRGACPCSHTHVLGIPLLAMPRASCMVSVYVDVPEHRGLHAVGPQHLLDARGAAVCQGHWRALSPAPPGRASLNARSIESAGEVQLGNSANLCGAWNALPARKRWIGVSFRADAAASARRRQVAVLAGLAHTCAATHGQSERHEWPECGLHYRRRSWHCLATARHAQVRAGLGASRPPVPDRQPHDLGAGYRAHAPTRA